VKENRGCAGIDGVSLEEFAQRLNENLKQLKGELENKSYKPLRLLKVLIEEDGNKRALAIPTVRDRVAQTAVYQVIEPLFEKEFEECSFGYRKNRSVKIAVYRIQELRDKGYRWVMDADVDSFFNNIDHSLLFQKIEKIISDPDILGLIQMWVKAEVFDNGAIYKMEKGIPLGSVISPLLANLFLDELDEKLMEEGFKLVRYADDFLVLCRDPDRANEALEVTDEILSALELRLNLKKTKVTSFDFGFKFLGVIFLKSLIMESKNRDWD